MLPPSSADGVRARAREWDGHVGAAGLLGCWAVVNGVRWVMALVWGGEAWGGEGWLGCSQLAFKGEGRAVPGCVGRGLLAVPTRRGSSAAACRPCREGRCSGRWRRAPQG